MPWIVTRTFLERYLPAFRLEQSTGDDFTESDCRSLLSAVAVLAKGEPTPPNLCPPRLRQKTIHRHLPDFLDVSLGWVVSEAFRDLAEALEPGVHRFMPAEVLDRGGEPVRKRYFICLIGNRVEANRGPVASVATPAPARSTDRGIARVHLWCHLPSGAKYFSDELKRAVDKAKLRKLEFQYVAGADASLWPSGQPADEHIALNRE